MSGNRHRPSERRRVTLRNMLLRSCVVALLVSACAGAGDESGSTTSSSPDSATTTDRTFTSVVPSTSGESLPDYLDEGLIDEVRELASDETGIPPGEFEVETAVEVTWSDGSLGCPQPGQAYTQALVDGYWVVLSHDSDTYDYRAGPDREFRLCPGGGAPPVSVYEDR